MVQPQAGTPGACRSWRKQEGPPQQPPDGAQPWDTWVLVSLLILVLPEAWEPFVGTAGVLAGAPPGAPGEAATQFL